LVFDDDALVPEELRMAYRILKNAGFVPPEVQTLREIGDLERHMEGLPRGGARARAVRKLQLLRLRLEAGGRLQHVLSAGSGYDQRLLDHFASRHVPADDRAAACGDGAEGQ
jgi:hypothetical protein